MAWNPSAGEEVQQPWNPSAGEEVQQPSVSQLQSAYKRWQQPGVGFSGLTPEEQDALHQEHQSSAAARKGIDWGHVVDFMDTKAGYDTSNAAKQATAGLNTDLKSKQEPLFDIQAKAGEAASRGIPPTLQEQLGRQVLPRVMAANDYANEGINVGIPRTAASALADILSLPGRTGSGIVESVRQLTKPGKMDYESGYSTMANPKGSSDIGVMDFISNVAKDPFTPLMAVSGPKLASSAKMAAGEIAEKLGARTPAVARKVMEALNPAEHGIIGNVATLPGKAYRGAVEAIEPTVAKYLGHRATPAAIGAAQGAGVGLAQTLLDHVQRSPALNNLSDYFLSMGVGAGFGGGSAAALAEAQKRAILNFPGQRNAVAKSENTVGDYIIHPEDIGNILNTVRGGSSSSYHDLAAAMEGASTKQMKAATQAAMDDIAAGRSKPLPLTPEAELQMTGGFKSPSYKPDWGKAEALETLDDQVAYPRPFRMSAEASSSDEPSNLSALAAQYLSKVRGSSASDITSARDQFMQSLTALGEKQTPLTSPKLLPWEVKTFTGENAMRMRGSEHAIDNRLRDVLNDGQPGNLLDVANKHAGYADDIAKVNTAIQLKAKIADAGSNVVEDIIKRGNKISNDLLDVVAEKESYLNSGKNVPKELLLREAVLDQQLGAVQNEAHKAAIKVGAPLKDFFGLQQTGDELQNAWLGDVAKGLGVGTNKYPFQALPTDMPTWKSMLNESIRVRPNDKRLMTEDNALALKRALDADTERRYPSYLPIMEGLVDGEFKGKNAKKMFGLAAKLDQAISTASKAVGTTRKDATAWATLLPGDAGRLARMMSQNKKNYTADMGSNNTLWQLMHDAYNDVGMLRDRGGYAPSPIAPTIAHGMADAKSKDDYDSIATAANKHQMNAKLKALFMK